MINSDNKIISGNEISSFCVTGQQVNDNSFIKITPERVYVAAVATKVAAVALGVLLVCNVIGLTVAATSIMFVLSASIGLSLYKNYLNQIASQIDSYNCLADRSALSNQTFSTEAFPTQHSADTEVWRMKMIESAQHNIVISGNYCGGKAMMATLDKIEERLKEVPDLKCVIISSPKFLDENIRTRLEGLKSRFQNNFSLVLSPDVVHIGNGLKFSTNHTKCTVIDFGKYFILGGSGIKDNFCGTGISGYSKKQFLEERGLENSYESDASGASFWNKLLGSFRDMDFVFKTKGDNDEGCRIFSQSLLLAYRWEQYNKQVNKGVFETASVPLENIGQLGVSKFGGVRCAAYADEESVPDSVTFELPKSSPKELRHVNTVVEGFEAQSLAKDVTTKIITSGPQDATSNFGTAVLDQNSVTVELLKSQPKKLSEVATVVEGFEAQSLAKDVKTKIITSGPQDATSNFGTAVLDQIKKAQKRLVINHMYFHPTEEIMQEIANAAKRGVKVTVISCNVFKDCPKSHYVFGARNKHNYMRLFESLTPEERQNVEVYNFEQKNIGTHKKVIIVDDSVLAGSSNLGYKSLVTASDDEINFLCDSEKFADETWKVCQKDIEKSSKFEYKKGALTIAERCNSYFHYLLSAVHG